METNKETARYFGKCRTCKQGAVRDFQTIGGNRLPIVVLANGKQEVIYQAAEMGFFRCACGGIIKGWTALKAKISAKHVCGAKCIASKGPSCECSCGGKNHGSSHLVAA